MSPRVLGLASAGVGPRTEFRVDIAMFLVPYRVPDLYASWVLDWSLVREMGPGSRFLVPWSIPILGPCRGDDAEDVLSTH